MDCMDGISREHNSLMRVTAAQEKERYIHKRGLVKSI